MFNPVKKYRALTRAVGATLLSFVTQNASLQAASPTTIFNASSATGFDNTTFTSLQLGAYFNAPASSSFSYSPSSLTTLNGSLLVGVVTDANSSSGINYNEIYTLNLTNLSVSILGLNDDSHEIVGSTGANSYSPALVISSPTGTIVGNQARDVEASSTTPTGQDVFTSNNGAAPAVIPLPTTVLEGNGAYSYTSSQTKTEVHSLSAAAGSTLYSFFSTNAAGPTGIVVGQIARYAGNGYSGTNGPGALLGYDGFYYNPATGVTTAIGLTGGQYDYNFTSQVSDPTLMNHSATVTGTAGSAATGFSFLFAPDGSRAGYDGWIYTPTAGTVQIGLTGGAYTYTTNGYRYELTQVFRTNNLGQIAGKSSLVSSPGDPLNSPADAWLYTPSATPGTASTFGTSSAGTYARLGLIANPTGNTLGYTNPAAANSSYCNITFLANNGHAAGVSNRYDSSGTYQGQAAFYYNGSSNVDISPGALNPLDTIHPAVAGGGIASTNTITALNNTGMAAGYATRYASTTASASSLGQDAYIYDSNTGKEYFVDPAHEASTTSFAYSYVGTLSDSGYAVGYFNNYSTGTTQTAATLFVWSELGGLQTLKTFADNGSVAQGNAITLQSYVGSFQFGSDGELYGPSAIKGATSLVAYGLNVTWNNSLGTGTGQTWDTTSQNWTNGVIPLVYIDSAIVTFNDANNGHYGVTLNSTVYPNAVTFNNSAGNYTLSGSGGIAGAGSLNKLGTASVTLSTINTYTGATNVSGGTLILAVAGALPSGTNLNIGSGASVVANNLGTSYGLTVGSLAVLGKLDLNNNGLVVQNSSIGVVTPLLKSGYNNGNWNGSTGIISTTAATNASHLTALGAIINDKGANTGPATGAPLYTSLDGAPTVDGDILVKYTYYGDANLSGVVDGSDYTLIDNGYHNHLTGWYNGDFNYDQVVDGSDYTLIDNAFDTQGGTLAAGTSAQFATTTAEISGNPDSVAVPEPASAALLGLSGVLRAGRRRRQIR